VSDPAHLAEGALLWEPSAAFQEATTLTDYRRWLERERALTFLDYAAMWRWSVDDLEGFWSSVVDYYRIPIHGHWDRVVGPVTMPGARWFSGADINYAEALLGRVTRDAPALLFQSERHRLQEVSGGELTDQVAAVVAGLRRLGVGRGDRVAAVIPNIPEAVVAMLACASLGAIWSSCSPDFGTQSVVDRFAQIEPTVLIAVDGYTYGGRTFDRRQVVTGLRAALPSLRRTVLIPYLYPDAGPGDPSEMAWADLMAGPIEALTFEPVPFDHPLWVLYSSGTTGLPKAIVHGHGGVVLEHAKAIGLQFDVRPGDRMSWFTTTGWMMWNFLVGSMLVGGVPVLYDGSPGYPTLGVTWDLAAEARVSLFGTSAAFVGACMKAGIRPREGRDLSSLRSIGVTGSPLSADGFGWVYDAVKRDVWLVSMSGGTDVVSAFVGGCPWLPVRAGELQARALGARVEAFDAVGRSVVDETGELVLTAPLPSMPIFFWNDPDGTRYRESYFETYPGVWRHGDWIRITQRGSAIIEGRSDSTLNRGGIRFGTSELYGVVERLPEVDDSLVIGLELPDGRYWMPLFVVLAEGASLDAATRARINGAIRSALSRRHVPDDIIGIPAVPRTLTGKKLEVPVKRLLLGRPLSEVAAAGAIADPHALDFFVEYAHVVARLGADADGYPADMARERAEAYPRLVVALDGPGSSGKSSVGAAAALEVGYRFCDTGLLYRAVTWLALARTVSASYPHAMRGLVDEVELGPDSHGRLARVLVDGVDHTDDVHGPKVDAAVSAISAIPELRAALLDRQRDLAADGGIVMAGRDIGTVVLPDADLKIYLDASAEERARRRTRERGLDPDGPEAEAILDALRLRDSLDSNRAVAPLRIAPDARVISTDGNRFGDTVDAVVNAIHDAAARRADELAESGTGA